MSYYIKFTSIFSFSSCSHSSFLHLFLTNHILFILSCHRYNNKQKTFWKLLYLIMLGSLLIRLNDFSVLLGKIYIYLSIHSFLLCSLGCTVITFLASYENYPSGYALKELHRTGRSFIPQVPKWLCMCERSNLVMHSLFFIPIFCAG